MFAEKGPFMAYETLLIEIHDQTGIIRKEKKKNK